MVKAYPGLGQLVTYVILLLFGELFMVEYPLRDKVWGLIELTHIKWCVKTINLIIQPLLKPIQWRPSVLRIKSSLFQCPPRSWWFGPCPSSRLPLKLCFLSSFGSSHTDLWMIQRDISVPGGSPLAILRPGGLSPRLPLCLASPLSSLVLSSKVASSKRTL